MHFRRTLLTAALAAATSANAGTMIENANGYTLNAKGKLLRFQALAFDDSGKLVAVGSAREVAARAKGFKRIDVQGKTVLPGLIDAHGHVFGLGEVATSVDLYSPASLQAAQASVATFAQANPQRKWVIGKGWNEHGNWAVSRTWPNSMPW